MWVLSPEEFADLAGQSQVHQLYTVGECMVMSCERLVELVSY
jgi:hypothetical protein